MEFFSSLMILHLWKYGFMIGIPISAYVMKLDFWTQEILVTPYVAVKSMAQTQQRTKTSSKLP